MKKLSKDQKKRKEQLSKQLSEDHGVLQAAVERFNKVVEEQWAAVEDAQNQFNETLQAAKDFTEEIADAVDSYINEKSDKWQESEAAQNAMEWRDEWSGFEADVEESALDKPETYEVVDDPGDTLDGLREEVE